MGCMPSKKKRSRISTSDVDGQRHAFQTAIVCVVNRHRVAAAAGSEARACEPWQTGNAAAMEEDSEEEVLSLAFPDQGEAMAALFQVVVLNAVVITGKQPHKVQMLELGAKDWRSWWSLRGLPGWGIARLWRPRRSSRRVRGTKVLIVPPGVVPGRVAAAHGHHVDAVLAAESWADLLHRMWTLECPAERPHHAGLLAGRCKLTGAVAATAPAATYTSSRNSSSSSSAEILPWAELTLDLVFLPSRVSRSRRREARRKLKRVVAGTAHRRAVGRKLRDACVVWPRLQLTLTLASQDGQQGGATATATTIRAVMRTLFALQDYGRSGPSASESGQDWGQDELALSLGCVTCPSAVTVVKQAHSVSQQDDDVDSAGPRTWSHTVSSASCAAAAAGAVAPPVPVKSLRLGVDTEVRFVERHQQQACAMAEDATAGGAGGTGAGLFEDRRMRVDAVWEVVKLDSGFDPYQYRFRVSRNLFVRTEAGSVLVHHTWSRGLTLYHRNSECWKKISHPQAS